jgi:hypothetical protein
LEKLPSFIQDFTSLKNNCDLWLPCVEQEMCCEFWGGFSSYPPRAKDRDWWHSHQKVYSSLHWFTPWSIEFIGCFSYSTNQKILL